MAEFGVMLTLLGLLLALALAVAWILMPVMLASVRNSMRQMLEQQVHTNELLQALLDGKAAPARPPAAQAPPRDTLTDRRYPPA